MTDAAPSPAVERVAEEILHQVFPAATLTDVIIRTGGQLSTVLEVRCRDPLERVIVKIYAEQWRWKQQKEIHVYRLLEQHGAGPVPAVLHSGTEEGRLGRAFTVMTRLDGQPLSEVVQDLDEDELRAVYRQMGACLAAVHAVPQDAYGYLTHRVLDPEPTNTAYMLRQFDRKLREFSELGGDRAIRQAAEARVAELGELFGHCPRAALCHNDFHEGNVLVARQLGGWQVSGFIDVENAVAADPLVDLAKTDYYSIRDDRAKREALHQGYGPLPADWPDRIRLYRLYHALELWDWFASIGRREPLAGIAEDLRLMASQNL